MFSLIISVVSVVLVVLLAAATFYYGGDAMTDGKKQADSAGLINQSQQISAGIDMFVADNPSASSVSMGDLVPKYLTSIPSGWDMSAESVPSVSGYIAYPIAGNDENKANICNEVNKKLGIVGSVPQCSTIPDNFAGCCTTP